MRPKLFRDNKNMPRSKHRIKKQNKPNPIKWKSDEKLFQVPANPRPTVEFPRPEANSKIEFTLVPGFPANHPQSKIPRPLSGGRSLYNVTYNLSIPGVDVFKDSFDFEKLSKSGNSLLQLPKGEFLVIEATGETYKSEIHFLCNSKGILSQAHLRVECDNFEEAERFAHERVSMILSYWSFLFDIGIEISNYLIIEENTGTRKYSVGLVGRVKAFNDENGFKVSPEYRRILASYREAMNSSNLFYQALSFYKVIEGTLNLRKIERRKAKTLIKGVEPFEPNEKFPFDINLFPIDKLGNYENEVTRKAFTKYLGMNFKEVRDDLKDLIRNAVAHLGDFENVLDADRYDDVVVCSRAIPVLKFISRKMLENDFTKLSESIE